MDQAIEPPPAKDRRTGIRVLVILGHPRKESFCGAIANAYATGDLVSFAGGVDWCVKLP